MTLDPDPYRTLGLDRGAPLAEVKRAYRRLAKANHPDAAGEGALPRFLAIQAAYDQIAGPDAGTRRPGGRAPARRAWEADTDRAGATHRAYGGRPRPRPGTPPGARPRPNPRPAGSQRSDRPTSERPPKKATLGSTSYDDVDAEAFDPDWGGASWYGTTSGTYWTLNPKEYADPRKHGPEYQARARRAAPGGTADDAARVSTDPVGTPGAIGVDAGGPAGGAAAGSTPPPTHTSTSWWQATAGDATPPREPGGHKAAPTRPQPTSTTATAAAASVDERSAPAEISFDAGVESLRRWLDDDRPSLRSRLVRGFIAWLPVALGIGWGLGELSGCGRFAATCNPSVAPISWAVQLGVLTFLILLPRVARIGVLATAGSLTPVFFASVLLFATDPSATDTARAILGALMAVGWAIGLGFGIRRELRREARPLS